MLDIIKSNTENTYEFNLVGRLDTTTSPTLANEIQAVYDKGADKIILNIEKLDYVSSAGLRVILSTQKKMNSINGTLIIRHPKEMVTEVFEATGFCDIITIEN
jgi:anti-anti-sigma factor